MPFALEIPRQVRLRQYPISSPVIRKIITMISNVQVTDVDDKRFKLPRNEAGSVTSLLSDYSYKFCPTCP